MSEEYVRYADGKVGPVDGQRSPRYAGFPTFARLPRREDVPDFDIAVFGVPFDAGVTYRPGARFGPSAIRAASRLLRPYNPAQEVSPFEVAQVVDAGDVIANPFDISEGLDAITAAATDLIGPGRPFVAFGGDHTIALPAAACPACSSTARSPWSTSTPTWTPGTPTSGRRARTARRSAAPPRRASSRRAQSRRTSGSAGRSTPERPCRRRRARVHVSCTPATSTRIGVAGVLDRIRARVGDATRLRLDRHRRSRPGLRPRYRHPRGGRPDEPELLAILRGMASLKLVGADIVEVAPAYDHAEVTAVAAAHLAYDLVSLFAVRT